MADKKEEEEELLPRLLAGTVLGDILKLHMQLNATYAVKCYM